MTKVLFLLSAVVMVVAGFFSYQNRDTFIKSRENRINTVAELKTEREKVSAINNEIGAVKEQVASVTTEVTNEKERVVQAGIKLKNATSEAERLTQEVGAAQKKIQDYKEQIKDLPPGVSIETITEDTNKLKQAIADAEGEAAKIQEQVTAKQGEVKKVRERLTDVVEKIETRKKLFDRNSMYATIVAVNNDWGFVIIDGGENKGITVDTKLLVTRGTDTIGRLNIIGVQGNKTVANIDQKSVRTGVTVNPGDRVILETLYQ
jgi:predicted  nucleic acid-binding Zn-ribbon protein